MAETPQTPNEDDVVEATAEEVEIVEPAEIRARRKRVRAAWIGVAAVVVIGGAAALVALRPQLFQRPAGGADGAVAARVDALSREVARIKTDLAALTTSTRALAAAAPDGDAAARLAARIEAIEKRLAETPAASGGADAIATLAERVAALESRPAPDVEGAVGAVAKAANARLDGLAAAAESRDGRLAALAAANEKLAGAVAALTARVQRMEKDAAADGRVSGRAAALVLAAGQLREAIAGAVPFAAELDALAALAQGEPAVAQAVATLRPHAAAGVPTRTLLAARFDAMARAVVRAAIAPENGGWWDRALARLAGLVTVRPTGSDVAGDTPAAKVARSEARLAAGDLDGAVAALAGLDGAPAEAAARWLADARARLAADRAAAALSRDVIGRIGAPPAGDGTGAAGARGGG